MAFVAWSEDDGRPREIAAALGGESRAFYDLGIVRRAGVPVRYALSATRTVTYLVNRRPRGLIVTNPPIFPALIALAYARIARVPILLDSHPSAFGDAAMSRRLTPLHAWLTRRVASTLVTVEDLAATVRGWGGRADIVHEAPPVWTVGAPAPIRGRPQVLAIGRFAADEHTADVIAAAREVPGVDIHITGDVRKCPSDLRASAPPNVVFTGFLRGEPYPSAIERADVLLVLTAHPMAVNRAAYEAVYARRPLIISDLPAMTALFRQAVPVANDSGAIATGIREAIARHDELRAAVLDARAVQESRWHSQLGVLRGLLEGDSTDTSGC